MRMKDSGAAGAHPASQHGRGNPRSRV